MEQADALELTPRDPGAAVAAGPPGRVATSPGLRLAAVGSAVVVGLAWLIIVLDPPRTLSELVPLLVASGALCGGLLARQRVPGLAWPSLVVAALIASGVPIAISRAADPAAMGQEAWLVVAGRSVAAAIITMGVAALYATRPDRRVTRRVTMLAALLVAWVSTACLFVLILVMARTAHDPAITWVDFATAPTALFVNVVLLLAAFGAAGDVRAALARADASLALSSPAGRAGRAPVAERIRVTVRELIPGVADADAAAIEAERTRLAGDLHAVVLPSLRRAIADVEAGGAVETLADRLRAVDLELERLMADRWPVILEAFGLVEAIEDLAERTEHDAGIEIGLDVESATGRPPLEVERTGWRIVQLALDNAVRHAGAAAVTVSIAVSGEHLRLAIADDGAGIDADALAAAVRTGARGLADLRRRAASVGAALDVAAGRDGGTVVTFDWPSAS